MNAMTDIKDYFETCDTFVKSRPAKSGGFDWVVPHLGRECFVTTVRGLPSLEMLSVMAFFSNTKDQI